MIKTIGKYTEFGMIEVVHEDGAIETIPDDMGNARRLELADEEAAGGVIEPYFPHMPSHAEMRTEAMAKVDQVHASFLRQLTGNATIEERDTWKTKEEAARAILAGDASDGQTAMIGFEAAGAGIEVAVLAQTIIDKAEGFQELIGQASGLRAKARGAIRQATDEAVPLEQVGAALAAIFDQLSGEADAAVLGWLSKDKA